MLSVGLDKRSSIVDVECHRRNEHLRLEPRITKSFTKLAIHWSQSAQEDIEAGNELVFLALADRGDLSEGATQIARRNMKW